MIQRFLFYLIIIFSISCKKEVSSSNQYNHLSLMEIPKGFPDLIMPIDNPFTLDKWKLGKRLFFDPIMSIDSSVSCSSCHQASLAFSDDIDFSFGVKNRIGTRNSPSLANVAYHPYYTREGGVPTLEMQVLVPIQEHNEFDYNIVLIAERLNKDSSYVNASFKSFGQFPNSFVISRALACFERSLISGYSRYDQYVTYNKKEVLNESEIRGLNLFFSNRTRCSSCHSGFNFSNYTFANNGLYDIYTDKGRYRLTGNESDIALFKVPSLRNISLTSPYMHDGSFQTLDQIINHYNKGGNSHPNKSEIIKPLNLTETDVKDLVSFLKSLTDESFISNPLFTN